jgi:hypothetical protein
MLVEPERRPLRRDYAVIYTVDGQVLRAAENAQLF